MNTSQSKDILAKFTRKMMSVVMVNFSSEITLIMKNIQYVGHGSKVSDMEFVSYIFLNTDILSTHMLQVLRSMLM